MQGGQEASVIDGRASFINLIAPKIPGITTLLFYPVIVCIICLEFFLRLENNPGILGVAHNSD
ncbi:MAG TPA: hypothetical protein VH500_14395 [Nitrososphaeraceae archaeon]